MATLAQSLPDRTALLRRALQADAVVSGVSSVSLLVAAGPIAVATGAPAGLLQILGVAFVIFTAGVAFAATRPTINRAQAWTIALLNFGWVALSVAALALSWLPLTPAGFWAVVAQAVVVDLIGVAQYLGLRRSK